MAVNVLYMIDNLHYGGTEKQLFELIRHLDRNRVQPVLCTLKSSAALYDELDIPKLCLDFTSFASPRSFAVAKKLSAFIIRHQVQVIQTFFQDPFLLAAMIKPFHKVKLVGSFRDLGFWRSPSESRKMRLAYPFFDGFIANSAAVKEHFVHEDGIDPGKIEVIYNGFKVDGVAQIPVQNPFASGGRVVGIVANMNRSVKRVEDFVEAAAIIYRNQPDTRFLIVGDGPQREELTALARARGLNGSIFFSGRVDNPFGFIRSFDVGVITSETEGFCNAIIEYMACGVPVVTTNVGGNPELVEEGVNGFLVPPACPDELAAKISLLLADGERRKAMGAVNAEKIRRNFAMHVMVARQSDYYESLVVNQ
ncbi:glycosyltransferase [Geobacter pickeringii]|uniref:Glycosyltransferase subfamily 4-like N-terminal domain-containing protein n=1 Tax=Geobacter pickeringii TaxID=345632 RepID=A0A0B5B9T0_9BACT|nr:glycosyltransferase [Geobacter pickeringii]AJE03478.1 hypothetical protein GPICK_09050 [Geobacter pickeringii]